jgi:hypothetical protein
MRIAAPALWLAACHGGNGRLRGPPEDSVPSDSGSPDSDVPTRYNACTAPTSARAAGTAAEPIAITGPVFVDHGDTTGAEQAVDAYDCAPDLSESGPEVTYALAVPAAAHLRVEVAAADGVDVDVQLLAGTACVARDDTTVELDVEPGDYTLVVDTFARSDGSVRPGAYALGVEAWQDDVWTDVPVGAVTWRHLRSTAGDLGNQTVDVLVVPPAVETGPVRHDGCQTVASVGGEIAAIAGINGGFFDACAPLDFIRRDGVTVAVSSASFADSERTAVWDDGAAASFVWLDRGDDETAHANGIGSWPSLVAAGAVDVDPPGTSDFFVGRHPRTSLGVDAAGDQLWVTADGRSESGSGLSLPDLAALMVELGAVDAVNLDGGGSTTLWIRDCSVTGNVNHPSDGGGVDHGGARAVSDGLYAF